MGRTRWSIRGCVLQDQRTARVADASIMPVAVGGTGTPTICLIGEKAAAMIAQMRQQSQTARQPETPRTQENMQTGGDTILS